MATMNQKQQLIFKILVIGESKTGKTGLVTRYVDSYFSETHHNQIRIWRDFSVKLIKLDDDVVIRLEIFDMTYTQRRLGPMSRVFYKEAVGCFIVFDVANGSTFEGVSKWKTELDDKVCLNNGCPVPCVLLANNCDLTKEGLVTSPQQMDEFCREKDFVKWFETSGKQNINVQEAFQFLLDEIMKVPDELRPIRRTNITINKTVDATNDSRSCYG